MKKEQIYAVQAVCSAVIAWLTDKLGVLFPVLVIFIMMMIADQISGMMASKREALDHPGDPNYGWSSTKWRKGIYKKFGYILTVLVGIVVDFIIFNVAAELGISISANTMFGLLCAVWLILNELLSIMENAGRLGAPLPDFLIHVLAVMKNKVEHQGEINGEDEEHE